MLLSRYSDLDGGVWSLSQRGAGIRTGTRPLRVSGRTLKPITVVIKEMMKAPGFWYLTVVIKKIRYLVNNMLPWLSIWGKKKRVKWVALRTAGSLPVLSWNPEVPWTCWNTRNRRFFGESWRRISGHGGSLVPVLFWNVIGTGGY